jgi:hypothetical protein
LALSRRRAATFSPIDPVWVFLGPRPFAAKALVYGGWKSLDFLGFFRPKRAFSMGYAGFSLKEISRAIPAVERSPRRERAVEAMRKGGIAHGTSVTRFLILSKKLSPRPLPFGRLNPKAARSKGIPLGVSGQERLSFSRPALAFRSARAFKAVSISTLTKRAGWCGCSWPMRSMSAEMTVPSMKYPPPDTASR